MLNENITRVKVTNVFRRNEAARESLIVNVGGANSSKTHSLCQLYIRRLYSKKNWRILVLRKTRPSLKMSVYKQFIDLLKEYGLYDEKNHNKSDMTYTVPGLNSYVCFTSMQDRERMKSTEWHEIWVEEANEFIREDLLFLKTRQYRGVMAKGEISQIRLSLNPVECWIHGLEGKKGVRIIHSTYKDNPFANQQSIETLEGLKDEDETYYKIYALGLWAAAKGLIYNPYIIEQEYPQEYDDEFYGLDFGFNAPSALIGIGLKDQKEAYLNELIYQTKLTNAELIELMKEKIPEDKREKPIYADSEDPNRIQEIADAGFNIIPAFKGPGSVREGIMFCKKFHFHSRADNVNLNKENTAYKWREDKNGNALDEPVKFMDHGQDGKRYAMFTHLKDQYGQSGVEVGVEIDQENSDEDDDKW